MGQVAVSTTATLIPMTAPLNFLGGRACTRACGAVCMWRAEHEYEHEHEHESDWYTAASRSSPRQKPPNSSLGVVRATRH